MGAKDACLADRDRTLSGWGVKDGSIGSPCLAAVGGRDRIGSAARFRNVGDRESDAAVGERADAGEAGPDWCAGVESSRGARLQSFGGYRLRW